jgi:hypothetical protein
MTFGRLGAVDAAAKMSGMEGAPPAVRTYRLPPLRGFFIDFAKGLGMGVTIWLMIGVTISGATWRLYDIYWVIVAIPVVIAFMLGWMVLIEPRIRSR